MADRPDQHDYEFAAYRVDDDQLMVTAKQTLVLVDLDERRAAPIPDEYKRVIAGFEADDCEFAST